MTPIEMQIVHIQARLFENASYLPSAEFAKSFMRSYIAEQMDRKYSFMQYCGEEYLLEAFLDGGEMRDDGERYSPDIMFWMGYIYRYWHYLTGENSRDILKQAPPEIIRQTYGGFHTLDPALAVENLKSLSEQRRIGKTGKKR